MTNKGKQLYCRKCEGHGHRCLLKNHSAFCQFSNCNCPSCARLMQLRKNAFIRRYRDVVSVEQKSKINEYQLFDGSNPRLHFVKTKETESPTYDQAPTQINRMSSQVGNSPVQMFNNEIQVNVPMVSSTSPPILWPQNNDSTLTILDSSNDLASFLAVTFPEHVSERTNRLSITGTPITTSIPVDYRTNLFNCEYLKSPKELLKPTEPTTTIQPSSGISNSVLSNYSMGLPSTSHSKPSNANPEMILRPVPKHFQFGSVELPTNSNCTSNSTYSIETHQSSATIFPSSSTTNPTISIAPFTTLNSVIAPAAPILQTPTVNTTASANTTETGGAMSTSGGGATMICPTDLHAAYLASLSSNPDFAAFLAQQQLANGGHLPLGASTSTSPQTAVGSIQQQPQMSAAAAMAMKAAGAQVNTQSAPASQKPSFNLGSFNGPDMMKLYAQNPQAAAAGLKMPIGMTPQFMIPQLEAAAGKKTPIAAAKDAQQPRASPTTSTSAATASNPPSSQQLNGDAAAQLHFQQQQAAVAQSNALKRSLPNSMMQNYQEQLMATMNGPSPAKRHSISALPGALPPGLANGHVPLSLGGPSLMLTNPAAAAALNPQFALMAAQLNGGIGGAMPKLQVPTTAHPTNAQPSGVLSIATVPPSYVHTTPVSRNGSASADNANGSTAQPTVSQPVVTMPNGVQMPILNLPDGTPFSPQQFFLLQQAQLQAAAQQHIQKAAQQQILSGQTLQSPNVQQTNQTAPPDPNNPNLMNRQAHILANAHHRHLPLNPQMQMAQNQMVQQQQQAQQQAQAAHQQRLNGQQAAAQASQTMPPPNAMLNSYQIMQLFGQQQQLPAVAASAASNSITSLPTVSATNSNTLQNGPLVPPMMMYNSLTQQQAMLQAQQQLQMQAAAQQHQQASALAEQRRRASNAGLQNTPLNPSGASQMSMMAPFFAANGPSQLPLGSQLAALTAASIQATQPQPSFVQHPTPISLTTIGQQPRASPLSNSTAAAAIGSPTTRQPVTTTAVPTSTSGTPSQPSSLPAGWTNLIANLNSQQKEELAKLFQNATSQSSATTSSIPASSSDSTAPVIDPIVTTVESTSTVSPVRQSPITTITIQSPVAVTVSTPSSSNVPVVVTSSEETIPSEPQPQVVEDEENPVVD